MRMAVNAIVNFSRVDLMHSMSAVVAGGHMELWNPPSPLPTSVPSSPESLSPDIDGSLLSAYYGFIKNFIGASGSSTVAIDNKIEQAMDLVKSHLMFAVREEVEVLKEKISELLDRISQLEYENTVLRANASQETLAKLNTQNQNKPNSSQTS